MKVSKAAWAVLSSTFGVAFDSAFVLGAAGFARVCLAAGFLLGFFSAACARARDRRKEVMKSMMREREFLPEVREGICIPFFPHSVIGSTWTAHPINKKRQGGSRLG